ncbi:MAG: hypothetical protein LBG78_08495 [Azoarcus sp.]|jgi:hypothetical protein|nr:hypothetical protein [Azoarcus sp.]
MTTQRKHLLSLAAFLLIVPSTAPCQNEAQDVPDDPRASYQQIDLSKLVPVSRMTNGTRAIFAPRAVRFHAKLQRMPETQKSDYLKQVMSMMGITSVGEVNQRVVLEYGGDKPLAAYVENKTAQRIAKELKPGTEHEFYAFHVYNNRYGPALVIISFASEGK